MDKEIAAILIKYGIPKSKIDELGSELLTSRCVIFKSELQPINGEPILHVNGTPDDSYPLRILQAYRINCDFRWEENIEGETTNLLLKMMNSQKEKRAEVLDKAIAKLSEDL